VTRQEADRPRRRHRKHRTRYLPVRQVHHSLRFDATDDQLAAALVHDLEHADVITVTEAGSPSVQQVLRRVAYEHGWRVYSPSRERGMDETAILWDPTVLQLEHADTFQPTDRRLDTHRSGPLWCHALLFSIVGAPAAQWWLLAGHAPAHVQGHRGFRQLVRWVVSVQVYHAYLAGIRKRMSGRTPCALALDWNLNIKTGWVRGYLRSRFPGMRSAWRRPFPQGGSHGRRLIDGLLVRGLRILTPSRLLKKFPGLDHHAVLTVLGVPDPTTR
jgi:hypothetical protein